MRVNVGSINVSSDCANWLKVKAMLNDQSNRVFISECLEKHVSKRKHKWLLDLQLASAARGMTVDELWNHILIHDELPGEVNHSASLLKYIEQVEKGEIYDENDNS